MSVTGWPCACARRYGADDFEQSIVGWEIVTANGTIINVDAEEDPELAVALRGSGSQFGMHLIY